MSAEQAFLRLDLGGTGLADCYPQTAGLLAGGKVPERPGVVLCDLGYADVASPSRSARKVTAGA